MTDVDLKLTLPDAFAREAEAAGLLTPNAIERLLREELRRQRVDRLFDAADRLASLDLPILSEDQIEAEIEAARVINRKRTCLPGSRALARFLHA